MHEEFYELFNEVFDEEGNVKSCGRGVCARLIQAALKLDPHSDQSYYGDCNHDSPKYGTMNVQRIKALRESLT